MKLEKKSFSILFKNIRLRNKVKMKKSTILLILFALTSLSSQKSHKIFSLKDSVLNDTTLKIDGLTIFSMSEMNTSFTKSKIFK